MIDLDTEFRNGLVDDMKVFDDRVTAIIKHNIKAPSVDFDNGQMLSDVVSTTVFDCLMRNETNRNKTASKSLGHTRQMATQNDVLYTAENTLEVPKLTNLEIDEGDSVVVRELLYRVVSVDSATLNTRFRLYIERIK